MMGLKADEIYQKMSRADASSLDLAKASAQDATAHYRDVEQQVRELSQMIAAGWQGNAAQAAQAGTTPLSTMVSSASGELSLHQKALADQQEAVGKAKAAVLPVDAEPPHNNILNEMIPWGTSLDHKIDDYNNRASGNTRVYNTYVQASASNGSAMPSSFPGVAPDGSNVTVTAPEQGGSPSGEWGGAPYSGGGGTTRTSSAGRSGGRGIHRGVPAGAGGGAPGAGGMRTDPSQWAGGPGGGGPGTGGPAGWGPAAGRPGGPGGAPAAFGPLGGVPGGAGEPGGGFGGRGGAGSARFGSGASAGGAGGSGRGGPSSGSATGTAEEAAMGRAAGAQGMAGAAGARGAAGGPTGMGGRGGKGEEDGEHRAASYLVGDRSDELAGELPLTAPPVIGE
jgi:hypothetical protein